MKIFNGIKTKNLQHISWFAITNTASKILTKTNLNNSDIRVLFYLLSNINQNNSVNYASYKEIANLTDLSVSSVKKSMMNLRNEDLITKDVNFVKTIFINPNYIYAGDYTTLSDKIKYYDEIKEDYETKQNNRKDEAAKTMKKNETKQGRKKKSTTNNEFDCEITDDDIGKISLDE